MFEHLTGPLDLLLHITYNVATVKLFVGILPIMAKTPSLGVRVQPETKDALDRAAKDDMRSVSSLVEKILTEWLREHDYLPK